MPTDTSTTGPEGQGAGNMIGSIGDLVEVAVSQVTGKVELVREWSNENPCSRQAFLYEHSLNVRPTLRRAESALAWLEVAGPRALAASIAAKGRPNNQIPVLYTGGQRFAYFLAQGPLPTPPGAVLAAIFGLHLGAGLAQESWYQWIEDRLPAGVPSSNNTQGTPVLGRHDIRLYRGILQGSAVRASYLSWLDYQAVTVQPFGVTDWQAKIASLQAKVDGLRDAFSVLYDEIIRYERRCIEWREETEADEDAVWDETVRSAKTKQALIAAGLVLAAIVALEAS